MPKAVFSEKFIAVKYLSWKKRSQIIYLSFSFKKDKRIKPKVGKTKIFKDRNQGNGKQKKKNSTETESWSTSLLS